MQDGRKNGGVMPMMIQILIAGCGIKIQLRDRDLLILTGVMRVSKLTADAS